jgi:hypothetical protein
MVYRLRRSIIWKNSFMDKVQPASNCICNSHKDNMLQKLSELRSSLVLHGEGRIFLNCPYLVVILP